MRPQTTDNFKVGTKAGTPAWLVRFEVESFRALKGFWKASNVIMFQVEERSSRLEGDEGEKLDPRVQVIQMLHNVPKKFQV